MSIETENKSYIEIEQSKPSLTEKDLSEIRNYEGIIDKTFGSEGQLAVLSTHAQAFFEKFEDITKLPSFGQIIEKAQTEERENPQTYVIKGILKQLGVRAAHPNTASLSRYRINSPEVGCDQAITIFANNIANIIEAEPWELNDAGYYDVYKKIEARAIEIKQQRGITCYEGHVEKGKSPVVQEIIEIESEKEAEMVAEAVAQDVDTYTRHLEEDRMSTQTQFERAAKNQQHVGKIVEKVYQPIERQKREEAILNLPEIVILGGVGQSEPMWEDRIRYYENLGVKVNYIQLPEFTEDQTFETQAAWLYEQLKNDTGETYSFEAHSKGGLVLWHLMKNHPELADHAIITSSPTRSNEDTYPGLIASSLKWCLEHQNQASKLIDKIPALRYFKNMGNWQEAFRVYRSLIGEPNKAQWDEVVASTSWTIPKYIQNGGKDIMVNMVGMGAAREAHGAVFNMESLSDHNVIGSNKNALELHLRLSEEAKRRTNAIVPNNEN